MSSLKTFKDLLDKGNDNALLRYSLGNEYLKIQDYENAITHLRKAIEFNQSYSAAWKLYAKSLAESKQNNDAISAYERGINIAEENGDIQSAKEMRVFLKRLKKD